MTKARDIASAAPAPSTVSATELGYLDGVTSNIQTQIDSKTGGVATDTPPASPTEGQVWLDTDGTTADANFVLKSTLSSTGDIFYASAANTPARLGIGSTDQVLKVSGGIPAWATPATGALTKIGSTSFSNVATQDIDSVFSSTYNTYLIVINQIYAATGSNAPQLQMRYSTTTETGNYYGCLDNMSYLGTSTLNGTNSGSECKLAGSSGASNYPTSAVFFINFPNGGGASSRAHIYGSSYDSLNAIGADFQYEATARTYTGFRLKSASSNISGIVVVYGVEK